MQAWIGSEGGLCQALLRASVEDLVCSGREVRGWAVIADWVPLPDGQQQWGHCHHLGVITQVMFCLEAGVYAFHSEFKVQASPFFQRPAGFGGAL